MKKVVISNIYNFIFLLWFELVFQISIFNEFSVSSIINILLYTIFISCFITILTNAFTSKVNKVILYITYTVLPILYSVQLVFKNIFNNFFDLSVISLSDQALSFSKTVIALVFKNIFLILLLFIPLLLIIIFRKKISLEHDKKLKVIILEVILAILSLLDFYLYLNTQKGEYLSGYSLYYEIDQNSLSIQKLGVLNSYKLDLFRTIFGFKEKLSITSKVEEEVKDVVVNYDYNTQDLDLEELKSKNELLYEYILSNSGTKQNEYTGIFEGKNLIYIVAESFNEIAISKELTPTLYELTNSGFMFDNFYTPNYLSTIGGEFQALTGLHPSFDLLSSWRKGNDYFPYGLSTVFEDLGYKTYAYHDHSGYFQDRYMYLKALGFDNFKACKMGLEEKINCNIWPESDVEMIESTMSDYLESDDPFLAYYMTVSGHMAYNWGNAMAKKHRKEVENLPYSDSVKAYVATQIELDQALELMIEKLKAADKLDDTVIVLLADHYPYSLSISQINEISSYERDLTFEVNHNKLIIYNPNIKNTSISKIASSPDVLPTVYNLFGINYDSRLFTGNDILSDTEGLAIFQDRSWISDKAIYDSSTNTYTSRTKDVVDRDYIDSVNNLVNIKLAVSREIINKNLYQYVLKK